MWEKELKIIDGLGRLYPTYIDKWDRLISYKIYGGANHLKVWWVYWLCRDQLNQRITSLERYIQRYESVAWDCYKNYFGME